MDRFIQGIGCGLMYLIFGPPIGGFFLFTCMYFSLLFFEGRDLNYVLVLYFVIFSYVIGYASAFLSGFVAGIARPYVNNLFALFVLTIATTFAGYIGHYLIGMHPDGEYDYKLSYIIISCFLASLILNWFVIYKPNKANHHRFARTR